jgi:hypothetical protein
MSDAQDKQYFETDRRGAIRNWVMSEMLRGGGYAAVVLIGIGLLLWVIYLVGLFLPEDSKNAPPPMPYSQLEAPSETRTT